MNISNKQINKIVQESIDSVLKEGFPEVENVPTYGVLNGNTSLSEMRNILNSYLYDKYDNCVGRLRDLHFKYNVEDDCLMGEKGSPI